MLGISISSFAYPLVVLDETGSPARAGLVGSVLAGTAFFLRLLASVLPDRWNRRGALGGTAFLLAPVNTIAFAAIAEGARDERQGRVTSAGIQLASLGPPVGPVHAGVLLGALGPSRAIVVYGCALLVLAAVASLSRGLRA